MKKKARLAEMIDAAWTFRFCAPSDDPDEQTAQTNAYRYVLVQIQRLATPLLSAAEAARLNAIAVDIDIYSAYDAKAELDALLPDIEAALDRADESALAVGGSAWIVDPALVDQISTAKSQDLDVTFLVRLCRVFRTGPDGQGSGVKLNRLNHAAAWVASRKSRRAWAGER
jgi:hypothetical protein